MDLFKEYKVQNKFEISKMGDINTKEYADWDEGRIDGLEKALHLLNEDKKIKEFHEFQIKLEEEINS